MVDEVLKFLNPQPKQIIVDATAGGGGHLKALKKTCPSCQFIAIDQDEEAIEALKARFQNVTIIHDNFKNIVLALKKIGIKKIDAILVDLGVSSHQLDTERGFSFSREERLDMRMDFRQSLTAKTIVNSWSEDKIRNILSRFGQERFAKTIASGIVKSREKIPVETTGQLVEIIRQATPPSYRYNKEHHFATNTFRALRMAVNQELEVLLSVLKQIPLIMNPGGKVAIITFHSLEDRMVKESMRTWVGQTIVERPSMNEIGDNPRARSAHLRGFIFK